MYLLSDIILNGNCQIIRDASFKNVGTLFERYEELLTFIEDEKYVSHLLKNKNVVAVCTTMKLLHLIPDSYGVIVSDSPRALLFNFHNFLAKNTTHYRSANKTHISSGALIHPSAVIPNNNVFIGINAIIEPGVVVMEGVTIGDNVVLRAGSTIGTQGFYFYRIGEKVNRVEHVGGVNIGNDVEIQANCSISQGVFHGSTCLGDETKLDNMVHLAHNVVVGKRCLIAASSMLAGNVVVGDDVWIGPGSSIANEISIGDRASISIGSVVVRDVPSGTKVTGNFAIDHKVFISNYRNSIKSR